MIWLFLVIMVIPSALLSSALFTSVGFALITASHYDTELVLGMIFIFASIICIALLTLAWKSAL